MENFEEEEINTGVDLEDCKINHFNCQELYIHNYTIHHFDEAEIEFKELIHKTVTLCGTSEDDSIKLLLHCQWNFEKLTNFYFGEEKSKHKFMIESGIIVEEINSENETNCPGCQEIFDVKRPFFALICSHKYCLECWENYLISSLSDKKDIVRKRCPGFKCKVLIGMSIFKKFLKENDFKIYYQFIVKSFTDDSRTIKWCPQPNCQYFVKNHSLIPYLIKCKCGKEFCFGCGNSGHDPLPCEFQKKWDEKKANDSADKQWIITNTKKCPKCQVDIEKNEGCMHMTCTKCRHEFCWICLTAWQLHSSKTGGYFACTRFQDGSSPELKLLAEKQELAKFLLQKYVFHFERYSEQLRAKDLIEKNLLPRMEFVTTVLIQAKDYPVTELSFLINAVKCIKNARSIIAHSYAFAYYMVNFKEIELFNDIKEKIEMTCERLNHLLEEDFDQFCDPIEFNRNPFYHFKSEVTNLANVLTNLQNNFLKAINGGLLCPNKMVELNYQYEYY